jgi:hypothetical protein
VATLSGESKSIVETVFDWPRGTRSRKWGLLRDQIWFPVSREEWEEREADIFCASYDTAEVMRELMYRDGRYYRLYLDRRMIWLKLFRWTWNLRLHRFSMGDDDAAVHTHPWWFVTIPLRTYTETVMLPSGEMRVQKVRAFLPHFRSCKHRHFVHEPERPFYTIVLTGSLANNWGFWPDAETFVPHREWTDYQREQM